MRPSPKAVRNYVLSLPERAVRSLTALTGGILNEAGGAVLPASIRNTRLYKTMVEAVLRFLIEQVGQVEGVFPSGEKLAENFLLRRTAGNGLEFIGILTFRASPVWVLAALADLSGAGRSLIAEIGTSLRKEGLIAADAHPSSVDQILDALEETAGRAAETINTPPLDVATLREEWAALQQAARGLNPMRLPALGAVERTWKNLEHTAAAQGSSVFEVSSLMALEAVTSLPRNVLWLGKSAQVAARATGSVLAESLLDHYLDTMRAISEEGLAAWWLRQFRPYLRAAALQFSPKRTSATERLLGPHTSNVAR